MTMRVKKPTIAYTKATQPEGGEHFSARVLRLVCYKLTGSYVFFTRGPCPDCGDPDPGDNLGVERPSPNSCALCEASPSEYKCRRSEFETGDGGAKAVGTKARIYLTCYPVMAEIAEDIARVQTGDLEETEADIAEYCETMAGIWLALSGKEEPHPEPGLVWSAEAGYEGVN